MGSLSKTLLIGRVGRDPEMKKLASGSSVVSFSLATTEKYKDKSGQKQEETEWHNLVAYAQSADIISQYIKKGSMIYVEGRNKTSSWDDKATGQKKYKTEVIVKSFQFLDSNPNGQQQQQSYNQAPPQQNYNQQSQQQPQYNQQPQQNQQQFLQPNQKQQNVPPPVESDLPF